MIIFTGLSCCVKYTAFRDLTSLATPFNVKCPVLPRLSRLLRRDALDLPQDVILPARRGAAAEPRRTVHFEGRLRSWKPEFPAGYNKGSRLNVDTPPPSLIITISPDVYKSFWSR